MKLSNVNNSNIIMKMYIMYFTIAQKFYIMYIIISGHKFCKMNVRLSDHVCTAFTKPLSLITFTVNYINILVSDILKENRWLELGHSYIKYIYSYIINYNDNTNLYSQGSQNYMDH